MFDLSDMLRTKIAEIDADHARALDAIPGTALGGIDTLDADDLEIIKYALQLTYTAMNVNPMEGDLPKLSAIIRAQAKLDSIGEGGSFVAIPF